MYATFIGGWHSQLLYRALATNAAGEVVIGGETYSPDFPTTAGAFDRTRAGESSDGFVAKLGPSGELVFSTFLGGTNPDNVAAVAFAPDGSIIAGGHTSAADFPTTPGAFDRTYNAPNAPADGGAHGDFFIARLTADGSQLTYGTYVGGPSIDSLEDLVVDPQGFVTAVGWVTGNNVQVFVSTPGAFDATWNGTQDGALARLKLDGAGAADLKYATLIGGSSDDNLWGVAFDPTNPQNVVVVGESWSDNYPTTAGVLKRTNPVFSDLFPALAGIVTRFTFPASGSGTLAWSSYFGSEGFERAGEGVTDVAINNAGEIIIAGRTERSLFPTTRGAYDRTHAGLTDGFLSRISGNGATLLYSTFFGGLDDDTDVFLVTPLLDHVSGNTVVVAGATGSTDLEITPGALDSTHGNSEAVGTPDAYVLKLALDADASGDLTVDAPIPVRPINGAAFSGSGYVTLEWTTVADPSGIEAYEYQASPKPDFPEGFLHFKGSAKATNVRLSQPGLVTWFWRVRAADRAGNLSAWSATSSFTPGSTGGAVSVNAVGIHPSNVVGGASATGVVWLNGIAPSGGLVRDAVEASTGRLHLRCVAQRSVAGLDSSHGHGAGRRDAGAVPGHDVGRVEPGRHEHHGEHRRPRSVGQPLGQPLAAGHHQAARFHALPGRRRFAGLGTSHARGARSRRGSDPDARSAATRRTQRSRPRCRFLPEAPRRRSRLRRSPCRPTWKRPSA